MLKNKWFYSAVFVIIFPIFLFINIQNNTSFNSENQTNLDNVSNDEMEEVIALNPNVMGMRIALANRYFEEFDLNTLTIIWALQEKVEELCSGGNIEFEMDDDFFDDEKDEI